MRSMEISRPAQGKHLVLGPGQRHVCGPQSRWVLCRSESRGGQRQTVYYEGTLGMRGVVHLFSRPIVGEDLPHSNNVARYCRRRDIGTDGTPLETAFYLRNGEEYLSTNWLEYFHESERHTQTRGVRQALIHKGFRIQRSACFAVLNVGTAITACRRFLALGVRFTTKGERLDPSHTGIYGYATHSAATAAILAASVSPSEVYSAIQ